MKQDDPKVLSQERITGYEFVQEDLERSYWVWDRTHTPPGHPWAPMFSWWWFYGCSGPTAQAHEDMPHPTSKGNRCHSYFGYHMVTLGMPTEEEKADRKERFKEAIIPWLEDPKKLSDDANTELVEIYEKFKNHDYAHANWRELIQWVIDMRDLCQRHWYWHYYCMVSLGVLYQKWEELSSELLGIDGYHPEFQKLMKGFDSRNFECDRRKYRLAERMKELGLKDAVLGWKPQEVTTNLEKSEEGKKVLADLREYLDEFGWRNAEMNSFEVPSWREDPTPVITHIQQYLNDDVFELDQTIARQAEERARTEREVLGRLPADQRDWFEKLMRVGQFAGVWAEDHSFYYEFYAHSINRYFWLQIAKRLVETEAMEDPEDIFFLVPDEVLALLSTPHGLSFKDLVRKRRADHEKAKAFTPEFYYGKIPLEEAMQQYMATRDVIMVQNTMGRLPSASAEQMKADVIGITGSTGVAEGTARVLLSPAQLGEVQPGEILVAPVTDSTWTPAFSLIKGVVLDTGAPMCHAAIIAREYGIPAILNTMDGTSKIKTGHRLKIDAHVGTVRILS
jgi:pyruvate,water dikinase